MPLHGTICEDEGVIAHMSRCEGFTGQVNDPITELFMALRDKDAPLAVEGMAYGEIGVAAVAVSGAVWGLYAIS